MDNHFKLDLIAKTLTNFPQLFGHILYALTLSVTIIVVAVPEGLPMMITLVLSSNMKRMLKNNVLVRKMVGIETAGNLNILFTDKTGTLTNGKLEVIGFLSGTMREYKTEQSLLKEEVLHRQMKINCLYNNESTYDNNHRPIGGNITDRAILSFITTNHEKKLTIQKKTIFNSKNKYSKVTINNMDYIKGAPEKILPLCTNYLSESGRSIPFHLKESINNKINEMTRKGIRVIALAQKESRIIERLDNLTFVGILFIKDEIRKESKKGVDLVKSAGVQTVMITGDNKDTAISIGKEVGIVDNKDDIVITSTELNKLTDSQVKEILPRLKIVARSLPQDKTRLVKLSEELGLVVGMTGDGVNDAPALKHADVGFSMGSGTEVAKEASDIVILDDNFLSISKAILFGRTIFKSIRKFIIFQLTINLCAISLSIIGPFIGIDTPVTVIQMLWINMIMDTLAGIAFSYEPALEGYMHEKPKSKTEQIMNDYMYKEVLITGMYSSILCLIFLKSDFIASLYRNETKYFMTAFFSLFIFMGIFNSFNARTTRLNLLASISKNKAFLLVISFIIIVQLLIIYYGGDLFRSYGLLPKELIVTILISMTVIPIDLLRKIVLRKKQENIEI